MFRCALFAVAVVILALSHSFVLGDVIDPNCWGPDIRVTDDATDSIPYAMLSLADGSLGLIWADTLQQSANRELLFMAGNLPAQWKPPVVIVPAGSDKSWGWDCAAVAETGRIHFAYADEKPGNFEIYHVSSDDDGATWSGPQRLTDAASNSWNCSLAVSGRHVYCLWDDNRAGSMWIAMPAIYFRGSDDDGLTWNPEVKISDDATTYAWSSRHLVDHHGTLHVLWQDARRGAEELFYDFSADHGATWHEDVLIGPDDDIRSDRACWLLGAEERVHLFWVDRVADQSPGIFYCRSEGEISQGVKTWTERQRLADYEPQSGPSAAYHIQSDLWVHGTPQCIVVNGVLHVAWANYLRRTTPGTETGQAWIHWIYSVDQGRTWSQRLILSASNSVSTFPFCVRSQDRLILVWADDRDGNYEIYAKALAWPPADLYSDSWIDFFDYSLWASWWRFDDCDDLSGCADADFDRSNEVNWRDLDFFTHRWLRKATTGAPPPAEP